VAFCDSTYTALSTVPNFACTACKNLPAQASYVTSYNNTCDFTCNTGYAGPQCTACATSCGVGQKISGTCTQTVNALNDVLTTCVPCASPHALTYSSGCTIASCLNGYILIGGACVGAPNPPSPPAPPPSPPEPPQPPPPVVNVASQTDCPTLLAGHWVGVSPITNAAGQLADTVAGNAAVQFGTVTVGSKSVGFSGSSYAVTQNAVNLGGANGLQMSVNFTVTSAPSSPVTVMMQADNVNAPTQYLKLMYNSDETLTLQTTTKAFGATSFQTSVTYALNAYHSILIVCSPYYTGCYLQ